MPNFNHSVYAGHLVETPELLFSKSGTSYARFTVACNEPKKRDGSPGDAVFIPCLAYHHVAEAASDCVKGQGCHVTGRTKTDRWKDKKTGEERSRNILELESFAPYPLKDKPKSQPKPEQKTFDHQVNIPGPEDDVPF